MVRRFHQILRLGRPLLCAVVAVAITTPVRGESVQSSSAPATRPAGPETIARLRAVTELDTLARSLPLGPGLTVGAWAGRDQRRDAGLRAWVRLRPAIRTRVYTFGLREVDVLADPMRLARWMVAQPAVLADQTSADDLARRIHAAADGWPMLWASGAVDPREQACGNGVPGWEDVQPDGLEAALNAGVESVRTDLLNEALRLRVAPGRLLSDSFADSPELLPRLVEALQQAAVIESTPLPEQLVRVRGRLDFEAVSRAAVRVLLEAGRPREEATADLRELVLNTPRSNLVAEALLPPPLTHTLPEPPSLVAWDPLAPDWTRLQWRVAGQTGAVWPSAFGWLGREAAWVDGLDRLRRPMMELEVRPTWTLGQVLQDPAATSTDALRRDLETFVGSARLMTPLGASRRLPPRLEFVLPLGGLWRVIRNHVDVATLPEREPETTPAAELAADAEIPDEAATLPTSQPAEEATGGVR